MKPEKTNSRYWLNRIGLLLALMVATAGCGGGGSGHNSPSEPRSSGRTLIVTIGVGNAQLARTIQEMRLSLDGRALFTFTAQQPTDFAVLIGNASGVAAGRHTVSLTMVRQTRSPSRYHFIESDILVADDASGQVVGTVQLGASDTNLSTGQVLDFNVSIP